MTRRCNDGTSTVWVVLWSNYLKRDNPIVCPAEAQAVSLLNLKPVIPKEFNLQDGLCYLCFCLNCILNIIIMKKHFLSLKMIYITFTVLIPWGRFNVDTSTCWISWNWQNRPWVIFLSLKMIYITFTVLIPWGRFNVDTSTCWISWNWQDGPWGLYTPTFRWRCGPLTYISIESTTPSLGLGCACKTLLVIHIVISSIWINAIGTIKWIWYVMVAIAICLLQQLHNFPQWKWQFFISDKIKPYNVNHSPKKPYNSNHSPNKTLQCQP